MHSSSRNPFEGREGSKVTKKNQLASGHWFPQDFEMTQSFQNEAKLRNIRQFSTLEQKGTKGDRKYYFIAAGSVNPSEIRHIEDLKHSQMLDTLGQAWQNGIALAAQTLNWNASKGNQTPN